MVALAECLEDHDDDINLLYLTDSEAILQAIHRWIGCGAKINLSKSPDADVLKRIIIKLQKRVLAGAVTLLVKVKAHRGDPLNEEADIRAEMGRRKEIKEVGWNDPTNRTIYRWKVGQITRSTAWTNTVRNRFRQKAGEIEAFRALEIGAAKWCREHIPRKGNNLQDITEEGISLLDDVELWWEKQNLLWACHASRSKDRMSDDGSFVTHQHGAISSTFTSDWYLRRGESRDKMGEWLKKATVRSQDQRRMLQANTHSFPSNYWRNKITKGKESNKCDLCRALWTAEGRTTTEDELPIQTLGHIQHQCEALSEIHTLAHHRCWRIIHAELGRLASTKWRFICINGEKTFKTIWNELEAEFPTIFNNCSVQLLENAATAQADHHDLTAAEQRKRDAGITEETIAIDRLWKKRPDGFAIKEPTDTKGGELVILEFKRMSCVTDQYVKRAKQVAETQYAPLKSALQRTLGLSGWTVTQKSFIAGARSLNEQDLHDNLAYFKVPQAGIDSIRSKLAFKIFDEYANILKGMYSTRFNGRPKSKGDHDQMDTVPDGSSPPLVTSLQAWQPDKIRRQKEKEKKGIG
jgi:ribonuclease HI